MAGDKARTRVNKLDVRLASVNARRGQMKAIPARIIKPMNDLGDRVDNVMKRASTMFYDLHVDLAAVDDKVSRAAYEDLIKSINASVGDCTVTSPPTNAAVAERSL